ncbi:hypothetical protein BC829DRAFT_430401 [Chytridium lagenaria]|nr:hypothetical protein BC829DRAFT_430401 [Chytridium lagenaria]
MTSKPTTTMTSPPVIDAEAAAKRKKANIRIAILHLLIVSIILPIVLYSVLTKWFSQVIALAISGIPPFLDALWSLIRSRRLEPIATLVVVSIILSIIVAVVTADARILLAKESLTTVVLGIGFLVSIAMPYNLIWIYNQMFTRNDAAALAELEVQWVKPGVRRVTDLLCVLWGVGLLLEAVIRVALIFILDINVMAYVSPAILVASLVILIAWTVGYIKYLAKKYPQGSSQPVASAA